MKHRLHWLFTLCVVFGHAILPAQQVRNPRFDIHDSRLPNGLRVIIIPDHSAPVYAVCVTYNVGSRNERIGRTGFAHLFEHMMFQGSENVGKGEHMLLVENNGGELNGTTNEDRTNYFEIFPRNQLDLGLFLESDRMRALAVNQRNLDNQRNAVQEERRLGIDNQPYGKSFLELSNVAYDNFAYKHSVIGSMSDLDAARLEDLKEFFRIYYAPNNAVLTLVGDLEVNDTLERVQKYFGAIASQPAPPKVDATEPEHYGERRETIRDALARLPLLMVANITVPGNTPEDYTNDVMSALLGQGESSRLYQHLVKDKQLATEASAFNWTHRGLGMFVTRATPRPGVTPEQLEQAIYSEIEALQKAAPSQQEVAKAQMLLRRQAIDQRQSDLDIAIEAGMDTVFYDEPGLINTIFDKWAAVTPERVQHAAKAYLVPTLRTVIITFPGASQPAPAAAGGQ